MFTSNSIADVYGLRTKNFKANDVADAVDASLRCNWGGTTTGTSTAYACSPSPAWTALSSGDVVAVIPHADCGAGATLNASGLGAKAIRYMGYATVAQQGGRKSYAITDEGRAFLEANREQADALFRRAGDEHQGRRGRSTQVMRAMHNLKTALRLRLAAGPIDEAAIDAIAAAIDEAAQKIGKA